MFERNSLNDQCLFNLNITAYLQLIPQHLDANIQIKTDKTSSFARKTFFLINAALDLVK